MRYLLSLFQKQWFLSCLVLAVVLGISFPAAAVLNPNGFTTTIIVIVIFLGIGFTLPTEAIRSGLSHVKLHVFIQSFIFLIIPAYFIFTTSLLSRFFSPEIQIGIFALACLPTTVSTCTVFTQASNGNAIAAMFNAALSNVLGVFLSPFILSYLLSEAGQNLPLEVLFEIIKSLCIKMIIPLLIGQALRFFMSEKSKVWKKKVGNTNNILILIIVFFSLAKSASGPTVGINFTDLLIPIVFLAVSHFILIALSILLGKGIKLKGADLISVIYAAPQKTLAMGVPLLSTFFESNQALLGIAILPLLFYHPWQLFSAGIIKSLPFVKNLAESS